MRRRKQACPSRRLPDPEGDPAGATPPDSPRHCCELPPQCSSAPSGLLDGACSCSATLHAVQRRRGRAAIARFAPVSGGRQGAVHLEGEFHVGPGLRGRRSTDDGGLSADCVLSGVVECVGGAQGDSPIQRLERCVLSQRAQLLYGRVPRAKRTGQLSDPAGRYAPQRALTQDTLLPPEQKPQSAFGDVLGELSQLVHRIGSGAQVGDQQSTANSPHRFGRPNIADNVFTCLKCSQKFGSLDGLVSHIRTTKHFSKSTAKDLVAPWERIPAELLLGNLCPSVSVVSHTGFLDVPKSLSLKHAGRYVMRAAHSSTF